MNILHKYFESLLSSKIINIQTMERPLMERPLMERPLMERPPMTIPPMTIPSMTIPHVKRLIQDTVRAMLGWHLKKHPNKESIISEITDYIINRYIHKYNNKNIYIYIINMRVSYSLHYIHQKYDELFIIKILDSIIKMEKISGITDIKLYGGVYL